MMGIPHPYLTTGLPGIGGVIKDRPEDFRVEEVPLYTPADDGEHTYFEIEKTDLSTPAALHRLARGLRRSVEEFGYAGLKDRKGVTRQTISIAHVDPEVIAALELPQLRVLWARRHRNKLRVGHLRGNRFQIRVRGVAPEAGVKVRSCLEVLLEQGVPNFYGPQRFGNRGESHRIGRAFLKRDDRTAIRRILGYPSRTEHNPHVVRAREAFMAGDLTQAMESFPASYREERLLCHYLLESGENFAGARRRMGPSSRKLYFTAYQSYLFNLALTARLRLAAGDLRRLFRGDLAYLHRNGAVFRVEDPGAEESRVAAFEISASGPIFGRKMLSPAGEEADIERDILESEALKPTDFHQLAPGLQLEGGRRPFRVRVEDLSWHQEEGDLCLQFFLPKGSFATTFLRELMKNDVAADGFYEEGEAEKYALWRAELPAASLSSAGEEEADGDEACS